jgi:hypothetical protein
MRALRYKLICVAVLALCFWLLPFVWTQPVAINLGIGFGVCVLVGITELIEILGDLLNIFYEAQRSQNNGQDDS